MEIETLVRNYISESDKFFFFVESYSICYHGDSTTVIYL